MALSLRPILSVFRRAGGTFGRAVRACLAALLLAIPFPAPAGPLQVGKLVHNTAPGVLPIAVFGADDRTVLPQRLKGLESKIGLLADRRTQAVCTAFCVAPDLIATAGHCLFRTAGEPRPKLSDLDFRLPAHGWRQSSPIAGAGDGGGAENIIAGSWALSIKPPIEAAYDWALVRLAKPVCEAGGLAVRRAPLAPGDENRLFQVAFHRDVARWRLMLGSRCGPDGAPSHAMRQAAPERDFLAPENVLLHACDTGGASSGSPILIDGAAGPEVAGINVGTYVTSRTLVRNGEVVHRFKAESVANTAVRAAAFHAALEAMPGARLAHGAADIRAMQERLQKAGLYAGRIDGRYGPLLRAAIIELEAREGRPRLGMATLDVLARIDRLERDEAVPVAEGVTGSRHLETGSVGGPRIDTSADR